MSIVIARLKSKNTMSARSTCGAKSDEVRGVEVVSLSRCRAQ